jgi:hypothetical protein
MWTTQNRSTNFTHFFMVYGPEAVLPTELQYGSPRVQTYRPDVVDEGRKDAANLLKELRDNTTHVGFIPKPFR